MVICGHILVSMSVLRSAAARALLPMHYAHSLQWRTKMMIQEMFDVRHTREQCEHHSCERHDGNIQCYSDSEICCNGQVSKKNKDKQDICCNERLRRLHNGMRCDGDVYYNATAFLLCWGHDTSYKLLPKRKGVYCCGLQSYNPLTEICCRGRKLAVGSREEVRSFRCCGGEFYNLRHQTCSNGRIFKKSGISVQCETHMCGAKTYNTCTEVCCLGKVNKKIKNIAEFDHRCCDTVLYNIQRQRCCRNLSGPAVVDSSLHCCGNKGYNQSRYVCLDNKVLKPAGHEYCGVKPYNSLLETCCEDRVHKTKSRFSCCGKLYTSQPCCNGDLVNTGDICCKFPSRKVTKESHTHNECCHDFESGLISTFDNNKQGCDADGRIHNLRREQYICNTEVYNFNSHKCCNGISIIPRNLSCCLDRGYDPKVQICCDGYSLYDRTKSGKERCVDDRLLSCPSFTKISRSKMCSYKTAIRGRIRTSERSISSLVMLRLKDHHLKCTPPSQSALEITSLTNVSISIHPHCQNRKVLHRGILLTNQDIDIRDGITLTRDDVLIKIKRRGKKTKVQRLNFKKSTRPRKNRKRKLNV